MEPNEEQLSVRKSIDNRLATVEGHIRAIRKMLDSGEPDCAAVLMQLLSVERSVHKASIAILNEHLDACVKNALDGKEIDSEELHKLTELFL